ncbi:class I SAM-dependent methyltransferase [Bacillus suaedae]|uniref:Methyltransferase domain-containing protein n=1 Tax=Halalkalibacter suaedae TaxID=2822140 RepID=A0A941ANM4_9BACI|nr:methyltransferase domain-containing protein [Bacillus suaedae]MBP3950502.1 methyltransferase domain-containing protein [Bacillus suaedae]
MNWNAELYDSKLGFVSSYGEEVLGLLQPMPEERILDLGCGTGDLTYEIAKSGAKVIGIDSSLEMISKARQKYPQLSFYQEFAETFRSDQPFDAVFSNAALHWMKDAGAVCQSVALSLRHGGRFVAEFGGEQNVATIIKAIIETLDEETKINGNERNPWFFPSIGEYSTLLEKEGFLVKYAVHFDRPTELQEESMGLNHWLNSFAGHFFVGIEQDEKDRLIKKVKEKTKPSLFKNGQWVADYKRIRILAIKR